MFSVNLARQLLLQWYCLVSSDMRGEQTFDIQKGSSAVELNFQNFINLHLPILSTLCSFRNVFKFVNGI